MTLIAREREHIPLLLCAKRGEGGGGGERGRIATAILGGKGSIESRLFLWGEGRGGG